MINSRSSIQSQVTVGEPNNWSEPSLSQDGSVQDCSSLVEKTEWQVIQGATKRGGAHLIHRMGFTYVTQKKGKSGVIYWVCARKNAGCPARVQQQCDIFTPGHKGHTCEPKVGAEYIANVRAIANKMAKEQPFTSAQQILGKVLHFCYKIITFCFIIELILWYTHC